MNVTTAELRAMKIPTPARWKLRARLAVLAYAAEHGIRSASTRFGLDRKTIRAWRGRWQAAGAKGLVPRYPSRRARRIRPEVVQLIEHARRDLRLGAVRPGSGCSASIRSGWRRPCSGCAGPCACRL